MSDGLVPINQQNALPIYSTLSGAGTGTVSLVGSDSVTRFWSAFGLDSVGSPGSWIPDGGTRLLISTLLDFRECRRFDLVASILNGTGLGTVITWTLSLVQAGSGLVLTTVPITDGGLVVGASSVRNAPFAWWGPPLLAFLHLRAPNVGQSSNGVELSTELWGTS